MALNPGMGSLNWNCTKPDKDGYSLEIFGTVVSMQEVQAREFSMNGQPGKPRTWQNGDPVFNIRIGMAINDGSLKTITFAEAGKDQREGKKPSLHMQLYELSGGSLTNLMGKTLHLWTWPAHPETNQPWGLGNPRIYGVEIVDDQKYELLMPLPEEFKVPKLLCNDGAHGGQPVAMNPQMIQQPQVPPMQGQFYTPPTVQPMQQPYPYTQQQPTQYRPHNVPQMQPQQMMPQYQQPMPTTQAMPPQQQQMPQGMDPAVAQAMQSVGAMNVQEVDPTGGIYDDDIPFA